MMQHEATAGAGPTPKGRPRSSEIGPPTASDPTPMSLSLHWQARIAGTLGALVVCLLAIAACLGPWGAVALIAGVLAARWP